MPESPLVQPIAQPMMSGRPRRSRPTFSAAHSNTNQQNSWPFQSYTWYT